MKNNKELQILIVEDDKIVSRLHKFSMTQASDNEVQIVGNGREALDYLDEVAGKKDKILVLLDLNMPVMDGWDFLKACHSRPYVNKLVVIIVTSSLFREDKARALKYRRVMAYYPKPLQRNTIPMILQHPEVAPLACLKF